MDNLKDLKSRKSSLERQIENCRNTDPDLEDELAEIEQQIIFIEDLPFLVNNDMEG